MKRYTIILLSFLAVLLISSNLSVRANDAAWNGWVEIGDGPNPDPDPPPDPPDPPPCEPKPEPEPPPEPEPKPECEEEEEEEEKPECPKEDDKDKPEKPECEDDPEPDEPEPDCPKTKGSPIYMQTGGYVQRFFDARFPSIGPWLIVDRTYNAQEIYNGPYGYGWVSYNTMQLFETSDGSNIYVIIRLPNGKRAQFIKNTDGSYTPYKVLYNYDLTYSAGSWTLNEQCASCGSIGGERIEFDNNGFLTSVSDSSGNALSYSYDATHRLMNVADASGKSLSYSYNANGKISAVTVPGGEVYRYFYDVNDNLTDVIAPNNATNKYAYDTNHRLVAIINPEDQITVQIEYDSVNRVTKYTEFGDPITLTYSVSPAKWTKETLADGRWKIFYYNDDGLVTRIQYSDGRNINYTFDSEGRTTSRTDANGYVTYYYYDSNGDLIKKINPEGYVYLYEYTDHLLTAYIDPLSNRTERSYTDGKLTQIDYPSGNSEVFVYNVDGQLESHELQNGLTISYTYDVDGNIASETQEGITKTLSRTKNYTYDLRGNVLTETDYNGNLSTYVYDIVGQRIKEFLASGCTNEIIYNLNGQMSVVKSCNGIISSNSYDLWGRLSGVTDNRGYWENYEYNSTAQRYKIFSPGITNIKIYGSQGRVTKEIINSYTNSFNRDNSGNITRSYDVTGTIWYKYYDKLYRVYRQVNGVNDNSYIYYDGNNNIIAAKDPNGNISSNFYDSLNRLVTEVNPLGAVHSLAYDQYTRITTETNFTGAAVDYSYDDLNRVNRKDYSDGSYETFTYDDNNNVLTKRSRNSAVFSYSYNADNLITLSLGPNNISNSFVYDNYGRILEEIDGNDNSKKYFYGDDGNNSMTILPENITNQFEYDIYGRQTVMIDGLGNYTYTEYDWRGKTLKTIIKIGDTSEIPDNDDVVTSYVYDDRGRNIAIINALGYTNSFAYNQANRKTSATNPENAVKTYQYDDNGNLFKENFPNGNTLTKTYNPLNKVLQISDDIGVLEINEYDSAGLLTKKTKQGDIIQQFEYDDFGREIAAYDGYTNASKKVYYSGGSLIRYLINRKDQTNIFYYDAYDRLVAKYDGNGTLAESNVYNKIGLLTQKIDAKGDTISYQFDDAARLTKLVWDDGSYQEFKYDADNNAVWRQGEDGNITLFEYDALNRKTKIDYPGDNDSFVTYNKLNQKLSVSNSASYSTFTYNSVGRIVHVNQDGFSVDYYHSSTSDISTVTYPSTRKIVRTLDERRRVVNVSDVDYSYASVIFDNQLVQIASNGNGWVISPAVGANGELTNLVYQNGAVTGIDIKYNRDKINHIKSAVDDVLTSNSFVYSYDNAQRLTAFQKGMVLNQLMAYTNFNRSYKLDDLANITNLVTGGASQPRNHNDLNQITSIDGTSLTYNKRGCLTNDGTYTYSYNYENQLVSVDDGSSTLLSNVYDGAGRLIMSITPGTNRYFVFDEMNIIEEYIENKATLNKSYIYSSGVDSFVAYVKGGLPYYMHTDGNQNVVAVSDQTGSIVERYSYSAYGEVTITDADGNPRAKTAVANSHLYTSRRWMPEAGIYYYRARYYSPTLKRFLTRDPAGTVDTLNLYLYVYANPVNFVDPLGLDVEVSSECVKHSTKVDWDAKRNYIIGKLINKPVKGFVEFTSEICKSCCKKDSKHEGEKLPRIKYELKVGATVSTGYIPVPSLAFKIPLIGTTIGVSFKLDLEISGSVSVGHDKCYESFTGGGCIEGSVTGFACLGLCNDEPSGSFELNIEGSLKGSIKFCVENGGTGFEAKLSACIQASIYVQIHVDVWWLPEINSKIVLYDSGDAGCIDIWKKSF